MKVRVAHRDDAQGIHLILQEVWGESLLLEAFTEHILSPTHSVLVAAAHGEVAGFISTFLTDTPLPRLEIDLVAVRPKCQAEGIGTALVKEALAVGANGVSLARASIRVDNVPSQRLFAKAGFETDSQPRDLFLWGPLLSADGGDLPDSVYLIPVDTLTYSGLWIEGFGDAKLDPQEQHQVVFEARRRVAQDNRLNTGAFVRSDLKPSIAPDLLAIAKNHGRYNWWEQALE